MPHTLKTTQAGEMHIITLGGITSYHIFTKAGFFRGGKIYSTDKTLRVLSGEVELIYCYSLPLDKGELEVVSSSPDKGLGVRDIHEIISPESGEKIILAGIPHIFRAATDCVFIESFPENTKSEEYERYRAMKKSENF